MIKYATDVIFMEVKSNNISDFFFNEIQKKGKYEILFKENKATISPRAKEEYYKTPITIPDLNYFNDLLTEYVSTINDFNKKNILQLADYQDLSYIFNIMLFNIAASDAIDLNHYLETRISFFKDYNFEEYQQPKKVFAYQNTTFFAQRENECFGLETPYIMTFSMTTNNKLYQLPLIRYGIDNKGTCFIYAVQIGRNRKCENHNPEYKDIVNQVNQGIKEYRNISPSFVLILAMFLKILNDHNIQDIVIPDFLFNRYKKYYHANTTSKSDEILSRMFKNMNILVKRIDEQIEGFSIKNYPLDFDSYYHIQITSLNSNNKVLNKLLNNP